MAELLAYDIYLNNQNYSLHLKDARGNIQPYHCYFNKGATLTNYSSQDCINALGNNRPADLNLNPFYRNNKVQGGLAYEEAWKWVQFNKMAYGFNRANPNWRDIQNDNEDAYNTMYNFWYTNALNLRDFDELRMADLGQWLEVNRDALTNLNIQAFEDNNKGELVFSFTEAGYYALISPYTVRYLGYLWRGANLVKMDFGDGVVESYALKYQPR